MQTFISILRGINVSGQKKILMSDLKALYESLKFEKVTTYIQSGNVVFTTSNNEADKTLSSKIEQAIQQKFAFFIPVIVRSIEEIKHIIRYNPFPVENGINTDKLHVTFLADEPSQNLLESIRTLSFPPDRFVIDRREVFLYCPLNYGETKLSNTFFEKKLKVPATTRNWKTINKLFEIATEGLSRPLL